MERNRVVNRCLESFSYGSHSGSAVKLRRARPGRSASVPSAGSRIHPLFAPTSLIGSASPDGIAWTEVKRVTLEALLPGVKAGVAVTGGDKRQDGLFARLRFCESQFAGDTPPGEGRFHRGDAGDNGQLQLTDAVRILGFLFLGQDSPAPPGPPSDSCGVDPMPGDVGADLGCAAYTHCQVLRR